MAVAPVINRLLPPVHHLFGVVFNPLGCPKQVRIQPRGQSSVLLLLSHRSIKLEVLLLNPQMA